MRTTWRLYGERTQHWNWRKGNQEKVFEAVCTFFIESGRAWLWIMAVLL
jgi:hypothetical protein